MVLNLLTQRIKKCKVYLYHLPIDEHHSWKTSVLNRLLRQWLNQKKNCLIPTRYSSVSQQRKDIQQQKFLNCRVTHLVNGSDMNVKFVDLYMYWNIWVNKYTLSLYQTFLIPICKSSISSILLEHESRLNCCQSGVEDHSIKGCAAFVWMQFSSPQKELNSRFQMQRSFKL